MRTRIGHTRRVVTATLASLLLASTLAVAAGGPTGASAGQTITSLESTTPEALVDTLTGGSMSVSNVTWSGHPIQGGTFAGMGDVGFDSGVILSSGAVTDAVGPNEDEAVSTDIGGSGDADLDALASDSTADAAVLEFDFVPTSNQLTFRYVFASDEYYEYVNSSFNDVFGFFVNGQNCAVLPGTDPALPVTINNVNGGNPPGTDSTNSHLFRANYYGESTLDVEYNGLTTVFTCSATVNPGETNHIKLAIADTSDTALDSAVFLQAASFVSNQPPVCAEQSVTIPTGQSATVTLEASDPNPGDTLTYTITTDPEHGEATLESGTVAYVPDDGFEGTDQITWSASDGAAECTAVLSLTVVPPAPSTTTPPSTTLQPTPTEPVQPAQPVTAQPTYTG